MADSNGFWSYVHDDDEAEGGRISRLARDVVAQYELLAGETVSLFLDKDDIEWGERWRDRIDESLASVAFFIPVLTPRFFMSPECRRELQFFARHATQLGIKDLVLPLFYVDVPALREEEPGDDLVAMTKSFQLEDWRDLRFADVASEGYRRGVARLADRLVKANREAEGTDIAANAERVEQIPVPDQEETPGLLDRLAVAEESLPKWKDTVEGISQDIDLIGEIMGIGARDIERGDAQGHGAGARARLLIARRVARELADPTERIWAYGNDFASLLHDIDDGIRVIIEQGAAEARENTKSKEDLCNFFDTLRNLHAATHEGLESTQVMIDSIAPIERLSRDLRPVIRRLRQGLTIMVEAGEVADEWVQLIDNSGVECDGGTS